jgi:hypothetical protein
MLAILRQKRCEEEDWVLWINIEFEGNILYHEQFGMVSHVATLLKIEIENYSLKLIIDVNIQMQRLKKSSNVLLDWIRNRLITGLKIEDNEIVLLIKSKLIVCF